MQGIENVGAVLQRPAAAALFAVIQGDGQEGQDGEGLDGDFHGAEDQMLALKAEPVDGDEHQKLGPFPIPEHMEHQHGEHAHDTVIREGHHTRQEEQCRHPPFSLVPGPADKQTQQQGQHHILVEGEDGGAGDHQVEGNLGNEGEKRETLAVALEIVGVVISFRRLEGEDGEGHAARIGHPVVAGDHCAPEMVQKHQDQGQDAQVGGVQRKRFLYHQLSSLVV